MVRKHGLVSAIMRRIHAPIYASRLRELVRRTVTHPREGARVLDVGCRFAAPARAIMDSACLPRALR